MRNILKTVIFYLILTSTALAQGNPQSAIASAHPLATKAGINIINQGGNAFDAAIAVSATLAVVEPYSSGLGGGGFWLLHTKHNNQTIMLDGREIAPLAATKDMYLDRKGEFNNKLSIQGATSSGIPGVPAALVHLSNKYGRLPLSQTLKPAINLALNGFKIDERYRLYAGLRLNALRQDKEAAKIFLYKNEVPPLNHILKQSDLANTLSLIASQGIKGFYYGKNAGLLVKGVNQSGGIWSRADLEQYTIKEREPISFNYRGIKITSASPPSSGGIALAEILGILEQYDLKKLDSTARKHLVIEAMRRAYADRATYLGDPDFTKVPVNTLTGTKHAKQWKKDISLNKATPSEFISTVSQPSGNGTDTTHYSIIDHEGNRVAATLSINYPFGSCLVPPGTGILLNDEMDDFSAKPGTPNAYGLVGGSANAIEPRKRPLSSMSPTFIESNDKIAVVGTPGGSRIISMVLLAILDFYNGENALAIVTNKRFHHQYLPDLIMFEQNAFSETEITELSKIGHAFKTKMSPYGGGQGNYGNMQIVIKNKQDGQLSAASDPRGGGLATVIAK